MSNKHKQEADTNMESLSKAEAFITKNNKKILIAVAAVVAVVAIIYLFKSYSSSQDKKAQEAFTAIENNMISASDSLSNAAALADLKTYLDESGSHAVGIAAFEAGIAAVEAKEYEQAIEFFSSYEGEDAIFSARALACIADCYVELGNYEKAYEKYAEAVAKADNEFASEYAFRAGLVAEKLGKNDKALAMYQTIKDKYPSTPRALEIEKYISRIEAK